MLIPLIFVIGFWILISYDGLRNPVTRKSAAILLVLVVCIEGSIWAWMLKHS